MRIQLSDHFTTARLLRFTLPSMLMMVFSSIYGVVDGFFVSNFVSKSAFAAVNLIMPILMILGAVGFMFGSGGSALIAKTLGERKAEKARAQFSLLVYASVLLGILLSLIGLVTIRPLSILLGAEGELLENCVLYGSIILAALPAFILQYEFQSFCITAEKPKLGLAVMVAAGCTNILLDALLTIPLGLAGAAIATAASQIIGGVLPLIYFARPNSSLLRLTKTNFDGHVLSLTCINGSSELMSNISMSIVSMLYNFQLMNYAADPEDGIAAYGVLMYVSMIFMAIFIGFSVGSAPIISYHYGAGNQEELKSLLKKSVKILLVASLLMFFFAELLAYPLSSLFVGYDQELMDLTLRGFFIFSFSFLFSGIAIYGSSFFTALNNGLVSALISFLRTLLLQVAAVLLLPLLFGIDGIWISIVVAELMAVLVTLFFLKIKRNTYHY